MSTIRSAATIQSLKSYSNSTQNPNPAGLPGNADKASSQGHDLPGSQLSEDQALSLLQKADVTADALAQLARNSAVLKSRKLAFGLAAHPRTPRHISIPLLRRMFTFDLMKLALTPAVAADIKRAAEEQILVRIESLPAGQKISLARRGPERVAAELLQDSDPRVVTVALNNSRLVEIAVVAALMKPDTAQFLFELASGHAKWSQRREVQMALLRSENTPLDGAINFAKHFSKEFLDGIVPDARKLILTGIGQITTVE